MSCQHCPIKKRDPNMTCKGESVSRYCELTNPYHIDFDFNYVMILLNKAFKEDKILVNILTNNENDTIIRTLIHHFDGIYDTIKTSNDYQQIKDISDLIIVHNIEDTSFIEHGNHIKFILYCDNTDTKYIKNADRYDGIIVKDTSLVELFDKRFRQSIYILNDLKHTHNFINQVLQNKKGTYIVQPNLLVKTGSFVKAVTKHVVNNHMHKTPQHILDQRLATCNACTFLTENRSCQSCGCFVDEKIKMPSEKCPEGFWTSYDMNIKTSSKGCGCSNKD